MADELNALLENLSQKFQLAFETLKIDSYTLEVLTVLNMPSHLEALVENNALNDPLKDLPLWAKVWPGSIVLGRFLRKLAFPSQSLLELGAGSAVVSLIAANLGFEKIWATDQNSDALNAAKANVLNNKLEAQIKVQYLDVLDSLSFKDLPSFDLIVASELLYLEELHRPILELLKSNLAPQGQAVFCTDLARKKPQFASLATKDFEVIKGHLGLKSLDEEGELEHRIYEILILKAKSLN